MGLIAKALLSVLYGLWLTGAGLWRFLEAGSNAALGFGLTTGAMALIGALLLQKQKRLAGKILIGVALVFVVGFFASKSMKEGLDIRVATTLFLSVLEALVIIVPEPSKAPE